MDAKQYKRMSIDRKAGQLPGYTIPVQWANVPHSEYPFLGLILCSHYFESPPADKNDAAHPDSWRGKRAVAKGENKVNRHSLSFAKLMAHEDSKPKNK